MSRHIAGRGRAGRAAPAPAGPPVDAVECDLSRKLTLGQFLKLSSLLDSGADAKDAVAAGGVLVSDEHAPAFTVLADAQGNHACICTHIGRAD